MTRASHLLDRSGLASTPEVLFQASGYLSRTRRTRNIGILVALAAGFAPFGGDLDRQLLVPRLLTGYLVGVLVADFVVPRRPRDTIRAANLHPRSVTDLVPRWGLLLPWLALGPVLATPALAIGWHPRGHTSFYGSNGTCSAFAVWPRTGTLLVVSAMAAAALAIIWFTLRRLAHRAQPADSEAEMLFDQSLRARSARSAIAGGTSLGLTLIGLVGLMIHEGLHSWVCAEGHEQMFGGLGNVYSWGPAVEPALRNVSWMLLLAAIPAWHLCHHLPFPGKHRVVGSE